MSIEEAFQLSMKRFDEAVAGLRTIVNDPGHLNHSSEEAKTAFSRVGFAMEEIARIKIVWEIATVNKAKSLA